jgi:myo-inositol-1-phosphate synthase
MAPVAATPYAVNGSVNGHAASNGAQQLPVNPTAARHEQYETIRVNSPNVQYAADSITSRYEYLQTHVETVNKPDGKKEFVATPTSETYMFKTNTKVPKTGLMLVGLGGNNGSTIAAMVMANRHNLTWHTKEGLQNANYYGSIVRASTIRLGMDPKTGKDVNVPFSNVLPMVHPNDFVLGGWDISSMPLDQAMARAKVFDYDLQQTVKPYVQDLTPLPSIYYPDFIAANQSERADNLIPGNDKWAHVERLRKDMRDFKQENGLDQVIVVWTANTERYSDIIPGVNDTADNLLASIKSSHSEVSPSTVFAVACILEGVPFVNGAPQNTFVPGAIQLAERERAFIAGDDLKTGQTRYKTAVIDFLVNAGIKPLSVASYNHLGNNDGHNLNAPAQFRSKEISKSSVIDDAVEASHLLYPRKVGKDGKTTVDKPAHCVVIKYMPPVGDQKVAIDDFTSELAMGGRNTIYTVNQCADSTLASPIILDLAILAEFMTRVSYAKPSDVAQSNAEQYSGLYSIMSLLSYSLKAPLAKPGTDVVNSLTRQRAAVTNFLRALVGLAPESDLLLERRVW